MAKCTCKILGETGAISGYLKLSQSSEDAPTIIEGQISGLAPGKHGISVNTYGNIIGVEGTSSSDKRVTSECGPIFNPMGKNHGAPQDEERMMGDLGNLLVGEDGICSVFIEDKVLKLIGPHSVIGRSVVLYAGEDDCARGGNELSLKTGNSGARIAAGVIGLAAS
mmetsp:Transcript_1060/g.1549  ORF Transcript_1060/g.1549 Transcript_1060/m.1549 type:complete len:166 (+) Transcript_1060:136-633(+)|eukprot:CAMPEP_0184855504 /NCGR_PEP_ID=MMETSP0580-20130426/733_1 /TAXON_ID=1118495 /ORGANISM="Dactyliosolen fragilissimus" /LENGTH=165 /DNA_ID=CAMNT_0027350031 /DNA_START=110 /DNA_END=607 /DNA_ORIENTATION=+